MPERSASSGFGPAGRAAFAAGADPLFAEGAFGGAVAFFAAAAPAVDVAGVDGVADGLLGLGAAAGDVGFALARVKSAAEGVTESSDDIATRKPTRGSRWLVWLVVRRAALASPSLESSR